MPIYAYKCESCGHAKDVLQKMSDAPLVDCPQCGAAAFKKQLTSAGFQLKGSGWYVTDFRDGKGAGDKAKESAAADKSAASTTDTAAVSAKTDSTAPSASSSGSATSASAAAAPAPVPSPAPASKAAP